MSASDAKRKYADGRDEMNLADFPISALQRQQPSDRDGRKLDRLEFEATRYDPARASAAGQAAGGLRQKATAGRGPSDECSKRLADIRKIHQTRPSFATRLPLPRAGLLPGRRCLARPAHLSP